MKYIYSLCIIVLFALQMALSIHVDAYTVRIFDVSSINQTNWCMNVVANQGTANNFIAFANEYDFLLENNLVELSNPHNNNCLHIEINTYSESLLNSSHTFFSANKVTWHWITPFQQESDLHETDKLLANIDVLEEENLIVIDELGKEKKTTLTVLMPLVARKENKKLTSAISPKVELVTTKQASNLSTSDKLFATNLSVTNRNESVANTKKQAVLHPDETRRPTTFPKKPINNQLQSRDNQLLANSFSTNRQSNSEKIIVGHITFEDPLVDKTKNSVSQTQTSALASLVDRHVDEAPSQEKGLLAGATAPTSSKPMLMGNFTDVSPVKPDIVAPSPAVYRPTFRSSHYKGLLSEVKKQKKQLAKRYKKAKSKKARHQVLADASLLFEAALVEQVLPFWYGTPWDFYGHTDHPGQGEIACGYLVSTALKHLGVNINRYRLAQQWPIYMVQSLVSKQKTKRYYSKSEVLSAIRAGGYGVYAMGLDTHVGFVRYNQQGIQFIHSNYGEPRAVVSENVDWSFAFANTKNYFLGKLSGNQQFLRRWLQSNRFKVLKGKRVE